MAVKTCHLTFYSIVVRLPYMRYTVPATDERRELTISYRKGADSMSTTRKDSDTATGERLSTSPTTAPARAHGGTWIPKQILKHYGL